MLMLLLFLRATLWLRVKSAIFDRLVVVVIDNSVTLMGRLQQKIETAKDV